MIIYYYYIMIITWYIMMIRLWLLRDYSWWRLHRDKKVNENNSQNNNSFETLTYGSTLQSVVHISLSNNR